MNKNVGKFLLAGVKFISKFHLKKTEVTYSACGPFMKQRERIKKFRSFRSFEASIQVI